MRRVGYRRGAMEHLAASVGVALLLAGSVVFPSEEALAGSATAEFQVGITILPAGAKPAAAPDPLAGSTWRAIDGPWLGTLSFASHGRVVHVAMAGGKPEDVSYNLIAAPASSAGKRGELHIVPTGTPAASFFYSLSADGRTMTLIAARTGVHGRYVRAAAQ